MFRVDRFHVAFVFAAVVGVQQARAQTDITVPAGDVAALIAAVDSANADATGPRVIRLTRSTYEFTAPAYLDFLDSDVALPGVERALTVEGNGATFLRTGATRFRFFFVEAALTLRDLTLQNGEDAGPAGGGAIFLWKAGACALERCTFTGNVSYFGGALSVERGSVCTVRQCTFTGNSAHLGGAIYAAKGDSSTNGAELTVESCTITRNEATVTPAAYTGGGIHSSSETPVTLTSTVLALNTAASGVGPDGAGEFVVTKCFVGDAKDMTIVTDGGGNVLDGGDPLLGPLEDNGGLTPTCALLAGSAAIDAGANPGALTTDQRGAGFPRVTGAEIDMGAYERSAVPIVARVTADDVEATGTTYPFTVRYVSDLATGGIDVTTLDGADLRVTGPNGFSEAASLVSVDLASNGTPRVATYEVDAPLGGWTEGDNGTYTITLLTDAVLDTGGESVAHGAVATFAVVIDETAPTAAGAAPDVTSAGATTHTITVTFTDDVAIDVSTLGAGDLVVNPGALPATVVSVDVNTDGTPRVATYTITPTGGTWDAADNATYTLALQAGEVSDTRGNAAPAGTVGTFTVVIDTADPTATAAASDVTTFGGTTHTITVTYTDDVAVDVSTLGAGDLVVNPGALPATFVGVDQSTDGTPRVATYTITPPGGSWDAADSRTYTIALRTGEVTDTGGKPVPASDVGAFTVGVTDPLLPSRADGGCALALDPARSPSSSAPLALALLALVVVRARARRSVSAVRYGVLGDLQLVGREVETHAPE